jgi:hypothetical protein
MKNTPAFKFEQRLRAASAASSMPNERGSSLLDMRNPAYSDDLGKPRAVTRRVSVDEDGLAAGDARIPDVQAPASTNDGRSPNSVFLAFPPLPASLQQTQPQLDLVGVQPSAQNDPGILL